MTYDIICGKDPDVLVNYALSYQIFLSNLVLIIISQLTLVSKLVCSRLPASVEFINKASMCVYRLASHQRWLGRQSNWGECFNSVEDFVWQWHDHIFIWLVSCQKQIVEFVCGMVSSLINQSRNTSQGSKFINLNSFELFSLLGCTTLHYDCSIIADLLKHRMSGISYLWLLLLNIMIMAIPACTPIQGSTMSQIHA